MTGKKKDDDDNWAGEGFSKPYTEKWADPKDVPADPDDEEAWVWE